MFDPTTEAHLRRLHQRPAPDRREVIVPAAIAVNLALWMAVFATAL